MELRDALCAALEDEYKARATYRKVLERFGDVRPFVRIVESEERHIEALERLFARYELPVPEDTWPSRIDAPTSPLTACRAAVEAERENARLYEGLLEAARDHPDVRETFSRLLAASQENHLPAFERCASRETRRETGGRAAEGRRHRRRGGR